MKVVDYNMIPDFAADTHTVQNFGQMLGNKPERSRVAVTLYPDLTVSSITEALGKVYYREPAQRDKFQTINSMSFEWFIHTNMVPKIKIAEDCTAVGQNREEFAIILEKKYYDKGDTFRIVKNRQTLFVRRVPERLTDGKWRYWVTLTGNDRLRRLDTRYATRGAETQYVSNYFPELSERGYSKFMYNVEKHMGYISRHRVSESWSSDWAALRDVYLKHGAEYFKMDGVDKRLMDQFYLARENNFLDGETNYDVNGKCLDQDEMGRDIPMGDGVITQFKRYCEQQRYSKFGRSILDNAINAVTNKSEKEIGNTIVFMVNKRLYNQFGVMADSMLKERTTDAYFHSMNGDKIKVGAHYNAYTWQGNTVIFTVNRALSQQYPDQGYGVAMDAGSYGGEPNISLITLNGRSLISGTINGMGGQDGKTSGPVNTSVDGSEKHLLGYGGVRVLNPYSGHIIKENIQF